VLCCVVLQVGCRMKPNEHYMDYTGSSVYCQSQIEQVFEELRGHMFGNPHSANPSSSMTGDKVEEVGGFVMCVGVGVWGGGFVVWVWVLR
jgi:hypothetical protein